MAVDIKKYIDQIENEEDVFSKAKLLHHLIYNQNVRIVDVAHAMGKQSSYICHLLRLVNLPAIIVDGYYSRLVSLSQLFIISRIKDGNTLMTVYEDLLKKSYTVEQTEEAVREALYRIKTKGKHIDPLIVQSALTLLKDKYPDLQLYVKQTHIKGKLIIEKKGNLEETTELLKLLLEKLAGSR